MNKNLRYERTLKTQKELKQIFNLYKDKYTNSNNFMSRKLAEKDFNKLTFADYEIIQFKLKEVEE